MPRPGKIPTPPQPKAPKPVDPNKAVLKAPRLKAIQTRNYGKGLSPLAGGPDTGLTGQPFGSGVGYGGS